MNADEHRLVQSPAAPHIIDPCQSLRILFLSSKNLSASVSIRAYPSVSVVNAKASMFICGEESPFFRDE
jgi:hypothetical protein